MQAQATPEQPEKSLKSAAPPKPGPASQKAGATPAPKLPRPFGRLTLLKPIARGGMGEVFLATAGGIEGAERPCVVKIIRREHAEDRSFLARFFDEARIQAQFDHPGVARVVEASTDPSGKPFVVVEYIEGRNLAELRNRGSQLNASIAWPEAVAIGVSICEALAHVHERTDAQGKPLEIVHRDLSPQNIMVAYGGDVKLIDFGTARGENRKCHTVSGVVLAKPGYVAPEVANGKPGGIPADLYAVGVVLWELIAGRRFLTGDAQEHVRAVATGRRNLVPIATIVNAPPELDALLAQLTAPRVEDRYPNARDAITDLVRLLKKAPSLANGERGVRSRIAHLMDRLYPAEPARSRSELGRLIASVRQMNGEQRGSIAPSPSPPPAESDEGLFPGTRYRILREIGRGAVAVVYEAQHVDIGRAVALKVLPKERCGSAELESRFRSEARATARLRHHNLVTLHDFGVSSDGRPYYAMELLEGQSLESYLSVERGMDWREALRVGIEACHALEAADEAGLVHRDIKPGNLFMTSEGTIKLLDFGVVHSKEDLDNTTPEEALSLIGTVEYMAPEQAAGEKVDGRADLYALGAVLYELLTGELPHKADSPIALIDSKLRTPLDAPSSRAPLRGLPPSVDRVLLKAMRTAPEDRYQSARQMRAALEDAIEAPTRARKRRRMIALAAMALCSSALVTAGVIAARDPGVRTRAMLTMEPVANRLPWLKALVSEAPRPVAQTSMARAPVHPPVAVLYEAPEPANEKAVEAVSDSDADEQPTLGSPERAEPIHGLEPDSDEPTERGTDIDETPTRAKNEAESDELAAALAEVKEVEKRGNEIVTLNAYRKLAENHPDEPRALSGWSRAAIATKGWGEALRAAIKWASVDDAPEAQLHLAKVQKSVGQQYGAVETLERLLDKDPKNAEAQDLLERFSPSRVALRK